MRIAGKLKQIGRKYVAPVAFAGALTFCTYGRSLGKEYFPTYKEVYSNRSLKDLAKKYNSLLENSRAKFNEYIGQGDTLSLSEQENLLTLYDYADDLRKEIVNYAKTTNTLNEDDLAKRLSNLKMPESDSNIYSLLNQNLNGMDWGRPNLEIELAKQGINIPVEGKTTKAEKFSLVFGGGNILGALILTGIRLYQNSRGLLYWRGGY